MKTYTGVITQLQNHEIFVFGSNTQGRHGKGAALVARQKFGAIYGQAKGLQGNSYAIVTKDLTKKEHPSIPTKEIEDQILDLFVYAVSNPDKLFYIAYSGKGNNLNAYTPIQMADMFSKFSIPYNIIFEKEFSKLLT